MDTINLKLETKNEIPFKALKIIMSENHWIKNFKLLDHTFSKKIGSIDELIKSPCNYVYSLIISFPKNFYSNNAYLITKQEEVDKVLNKFYSLVEKYEIIECTLTRVDYPFTYLMPEYRDFDSYKYLFKAISLFYKFSTKKSEKKKIKNYKDYGNMATGRRETFIFTDTLNTQKYNNKILIYNQDNWKKESILEEKEEYYLETLKRFPDLPRRMRIEVSRKINKNIFKNDRFDIDLKNIKNDAYDFVSHILDINAISIFSEQSLQILIELKNECCKQRTDWGLFYSKILQNENLVFDKSILKKFINALGLSKRGKEEVFKSLRRIGSSIIDSKKGIDINMDLLNIIHSLSQEISKD